MTPYGQLLRSLQVILTKYIGGLSGEITSRQNQYSAPDNQNFLPDQSRQKRKIGYGILQDILLEQKPEYFINKYKQGQILVPVLEEEKRDNAGENNYASYNHQADNKLSLENTLFNQGMDKDQIQAEKSQTRGVESKTLIDNQPEENKEECSLFVYITRGVSNSQEKQSIDINHSINPIAFGSESSYGKDKDMDNGFPFKHEDSLLGLLADKSKVQPIQFQMYQNSEQKQWNHEFLERLQNEGQLTQHETQEFYQDKDILQREIFSIQIAKIPYNSQSDLIQHIKMFHTWVYHLLYSDNHQFLKRLILKEYSFSYLFEKPINFVLTHKNTRYFLAEVLDMKLSEEDNKPIHDLTKIDQFICPVKYTNAQILDPINEQNCYEIDYQLIENIKRFITMELLRIADMNIAYQTTIAQLDLECGNQSLNYLERSDTLKEEVKNELNKISPNNQFAFKKIRNKMERDMRNYIWRNDTSQILFRIQKEIKSSQIFRKQKNKKDIEEHRDPLQQEIFPNYNSMNDICAWDRKVLKIDFKDNNKVGQSEVQNESQKRIFPNKNTVQAYNLQQEGLFYSQKNNKSFFKCYKEKAFLDLRDGTGPQQNDLSKYFRLLPESMTMVPLTIKQLQVLQTSQFVYSVLKDTEKAQTFIKEHFRQVLKQTDCFQNTKGPQNYCFEQDIIGCYENKLLKEKLQLIRDAISTSSSGNTNCDRLEFLGESVLQFMVVLEAFHNPQALNVSEIDFQKLQKTTNCKLSDIFDEFGLQAFVITDKNRAFNEVQTPGFSLKQLKELKQKNNNQKKEKLIDIQKKLYYFETSPQLLENYYSFEDYKALVKSILLDEKLKQFVSKSNPQMLDMIKGVNKGSQSLYGVEKISEIWRFELNLDFNGLYAIILKFHQDRLQKKNQKIQSSKYREESKDTLSTQANEANQRKKVRNSSLTLEQKADVIQSILGAIESLYGLQTVQTFLRFYGLISKDFDYTVKKFEASIQLTKEETDKISQLEKILDYQFQNKFLLLQAITSKSYQADYNYERLEFLGDSILKYLISKYYFNSEQCKYNVEQLHNLRIALTNNQMLSILTIEKGIHNFIRYQGDASYINQFKQYVQLVQSQPTFTEQKEMRKSNEESKKYESFSQARTAQSYYNDKDQLQDSFMKIFADVFEAIIGAIFIDTRDLEEVYPIVIKLMDNRLTNPELLEQSIHQEKLYQLWNSKPYTKNLSLRHGVQLLGFNCYRSTNESNKVYYIGYIQNQQVRKIKFKKGQFNKEEKFYRVFYNFIKRFLEDFEQNQKQVPSMDHRDVLSSINPSAVINYLEQYLETKQMNEDCEGDGKKTKNKRKNNKK